MRREDTTLADSRRGFMKADAFGFPHLACQLKREKRRVAFVQVKDVRLDSQTTEQAHTSNAEQHLLHDARLAVAAIKMSRDEAISLFVLFYIRVEQVERNAPYVNAPSLRAHHAFAHQDFDDDGRARLVFDLMNRQHRRISLAVKLFLPAVAFQALAEIAVAIEQADGDERKAKIACGFQVIARKHAKSTRIERQRVVYAVLSAEVCDRILARNLFLSARVPGTTISHVAVESFGKLANTLYVHGVCRHLRQAKL